MVTVVAFEAHAQRCFECGADVAELRSVPGGLDPLKRVPRVGGELSGEEARLHDRGVVTEGAEEELAQARADRARLRTPPVDEQEELLLALGQRERLERAAFAVLALLLQEELTQVGYEDEPVQAPVVAHLLARRRLSGILDRRLHFDDAAFRKRPFLVPPQLASAVEPHVGVPRAHVL